MPISRRASQRHWRRSRSGAAQGYQPWVTESGCVLWFAADDPGVATTNASIADANDFTTANWTKTGVTVTADASGVYDRLTASATTATTQQVPSNFSTLGSIYVSFTVDVIREADDWVALELFAAAGGRAWFNLNTGAAGTIGANLTASITALGGGAFRLAVFASGANYIMLRGASADNSLTCSIGHTVLAGNVTVDQPRVSAFTNLASAVAWSQGTANNQPGFRATGLNGRPALEMGGQQDIVSTEAAVVSALTDANDFTLFYVVSNISGSNATVVGAGSTATNSSRTKVFGRTASNTWRYQSINDAVATTTSTSTAGTYAAGSHLVVWRSAAGTASHRMDLADQSLDVTAHSPGATTPTRVGIGVRPDLTPDNRSTGLISSVGLWNVALDAAAVSRVESYLRAKWGTP